MSRLAYSKPAFDSNISQRSASYHPSHLSCKLPPKAGADISPAKMVAIGAPDCRQTKQNHGPDKINFFNISISTKKNKLSGARDVITKAIISHAEVLARYKKDQPSNSGFVLPAGAGVLAPSPPEALPLLSRSAHGVSRRSSRATTRYSTIDNHNNNGDGQAQHASQSIWDDFAGNQLGFGAFCVEIVWKWLAGYDKKGGWSFLSKRYAASYQNPFFTTKPAGEMLTKPVYQSSTFYFCD
jgi:hypothetical protein